MDQLYNVVTQQKSSRMLIFASESLTAATNGVLCALPQSHKHSQQKFSNVQLALVAQAYCYKLQFMWPATRNRKQPW